MKNPYLFFEMIYYKLNSIQLKGQSEENNAHFALLIFSLLLDLNFITIISFLNKLQMLKYTITNQYEVIGVVVITYLISYLIFVKKEKYNQIKKKYSEVFEGNRINFYFWTYFFLTFILLFIVIII